MSSYHVVGDGGYEDAHEDAVAASSYAVGSAVAVEPSANGSSATVSTNADNKRKVEALLPLGKIK